MKKLNCFSERLEYALMMRQESKTALAKYLGLSKQSLSNYFSNKYEPRPRILSQMSIFLDVTTDWLIKGEGRFTDKFDYDQISFKNKEKVEASRDEFGTLSITFNLTKGEEKNISKLFFKNA